MDGAMEAPEKQAYPQSYSFYYRSQVTVHNNAERFISINFTGVHINLSIFKLLIDHSYLWDGAIFVWFH